MNTAILLRHSDEPRAFPPTPQQNAFSQLLFSYIVYLNISSICEMTAKEEYLP